MRAVLVDPAAPGCLNISEASDPTPLSNQAVVDVKAISLNLGEVKRARRADLGTHLGWDVAGVVTETAADGSGPRVGTRIVGVVLSGGWAERVAIDTSWMAPIPENVSFADASTLPVAGLTALYALEQGGQLLGRRVLVTGASGGVGLFGVQLAKLSGATVTALVRRTENVELAANAGADVVVVGEDAKEAAQHGRYHCILESVGGQVLTDAMQQVARGGVLVNYGVSAGENVTLNAADFFRTGRVQYYGLYLFTEFGRRPGRDGLRVLAGLISSGQLKAPPFQAEGGLGDLGALAERLFNREISGKAVIHVD